MSNSSTPKIWLLILPSSCKHISLQVSYKNLVLDQGSFHLRNLIILFICLLANVWLLQGEVTG